MIPSGKLITTQRSCAKPSTAKRTVPPPRTKPLVVNCSSLMLWLSCKPAPRSPASNGLVLGGGTVRLAVDGLAQERCVVISLPLGITRQGLWSEGQCLPAENANS